MNWHNGFIRVWIVISAAWVGMIVWKAYGLMSAPIGEGQLVSDSILLILKYMALAILPPLAITGIGILIWLNALVFEAVFLRFPTQPDEASLSRKTLRQAASQGTRRRDLSIGTSNRPLNMS